MPNPVSAGLPNPASYDATTTLGVVRDKVTNLMWQQDVDSNNYTQSLPAAYCATLALAGYCDWRLPTRIELVSIVDTTSSGPSIEAEAFPNTPSQAFWTSSPSAHNTGEAWYVDFSTGGVAYNVTSSTLMVRCVR
jgi:hypothetical protein